MPVVPRTVVKEPGWGSSQGVAERGFPIMIENETNVIPDSEHHDPAEKNRGVGQRCVSRLPPANAPSDGYQPCKMFLYRWHALHLRTHPKTILEVI